MAPLAATQPSYSTTASDRHGGDGSGAQLLTTHDNISNINNNNNDGGDNNEYQRDPIAAVPTKLRRAEYVRVVDLVPNIDMVKLKAEMARMELEEAEGLSVSSSEPWEGQQQHQSMSSSSVVRDFGKEINVGGSSKIINVKPYAHKVVPPTSGFNMCL